MSSRIITYLTVFLLLASVLEGCAVINTLVSLKYETGYPVSKSDCISSVTGTNLCLAVKRHKICALGSFAGFVALCGFAAWRKQAGE